MSHPHLSPVLNLSAPRPGRKTYTVSEFWAAYRKASPKQRASMLGLSPGPAAVIAGISRQSIHRAIDRGTLEAFYVYDDRTGDLAWITVDGDSLADYIARNRQ